MMSGQAERAMNRWHTAFLAADPRHTRAIGRWVGRAAVKGDLIALTGELGAGKTQWVRGLAEGLGLEPGDVSSPTFVLSQEYLPEDSQLEAGVPVLVHIDAYRLRGAGDLESIGWGRQGEELARDAVVAVEWADRIAEFLPPTALQVRLRHAPGGRWIELEAAYPEWAERLAERPADLPPEQSPGG